jgi:serine/threonine protein kinase
MGALDLSDSSFSHYSDLVRIGEGSFGQVYKASDTRKGSLVAIKFLLLPHSHPDFADVARRFKREAEILQELRHPNVVEVYEYGELSGNPYIVMEFVDGSSLVELLRMKGGTFSLEESLKIGHSIAAGLEACHDKGVVHRDLKPENIRQSRRGRIVVLDFGAALRSGDKTSVIIGTPNFMSPEQIRGFEPDGRSDLFSAAVVLYNILIGKKPFDGQNNDAIMYNVVYVQHDNPSSARPDLPAEVDAFFARALAKDRDSRFADAHEFRKGLVRLELSLESSKTGVHGAAVQSGSCAFSAISASTSVPPRINAIISASTLPVVVPPHLSPADQLFLDDLRAATSDAQLKLNELLFISANSPKPPVFEWECGTIVSMFILNCGTVNMLFWWVLAPLVQRIGASPAWFLVFLLLSTFLGPVVLFRAIKRGLQRSHDRKYGWISQALSKAEAQLNEAKKLYELECHRLGVAP